MQYETMTKGALSGLIIICLSVATAVIIRLTVVDPKLPSVAAPERYDELQFEVLHRPHVTYLIDRRYRLCFATRKPDYQDLVQVQCTDRLLGASAGRLRTRAAKASDAGGPQG